MKIIPECLRLGDSFFTHMSVFGTVNKEDGEMPIHFDERDLISCVYHLGKVLHGGSTSFYSGDKPDKPGNKFIRFPSDMEPYKLVSLTMSFTVLMIGRGKDVVFN